MAMKTKEELQKELLLASLERFVSSLEKIAEALQGIEMNGRNG